jgi:hypothetical protein
MGRFRSLGHDRQDLSWLVVRLVDRLGGKLAMVSDMVAPG